MTRNNILIALLALLVLASCNSEPQPVRYEAPEVVFPLDVDVVDAVVGEPVSFSAKVVKGDKVTCGWYIDDVLECSREDFTYTFSTYGTYEVRFEAKNGAGEVSRAYTVIVADTFSVCLSIGDSLVIKRTQLNNINVAAIILAGSNITHQWKVDGVLAGEKAYLATKLEELRPYSVEYHGENELGSFDRAFTVEVQERPLEVSFSIYDDSFSVKRRQAFSITATALYGGTGLQHSWKIDGEEVSTEATLDWSFAVCGLFVVRYDGVNAKGETASREWKVSVVQSGLIIDDFETGTSLSPWWTLKQNTPGIELVDNPDKSGINKSEKCLRDSVTGSTSTSGYFDLKGSELKKAGIDMTKYNALRIKINFGPNKYYPRVQVGGVKYTPVEPPKFNGTWEELLFEFPAYFTAEQAITFRPLLKEDGSNISGSSDTNTRCVYIDDIEFLD